MLSRVYSVGKGRRLAWLFIVVGVLALFGPSAAPPPAPGSAQAGTLPSGFQETTVFSGLTNPTAIRFASDGRVFVAEKSGLIKIFDSLTDTTPTVFADLRTNVDDYWDRGLLGLALDPTFPTNPYVYVLYTYDHELGSLSAPPRWGDACPTPPGPTTDGCVVSGRLSRLQAAGNQMTGSEQVLVEDWCQQYPSHSIGTVGFGPDGALYAGGGDGANFNLVDYGQGGSPLNPCGDPPGGVGATLAPPTAEGGALRAQDLQTTGDPASLDGSIIRVDPATGAAMPDNPLAGSSDPNTKRIIAYGMRNPFRFTFRPGTSEIWVGDVGWNDWEEVDRILNPTDSTVENFGWPCYEGSSRQSGYDAANLAICESLYSQPTADTKPFFAYHHSQQPVPGESCPTGSSSITGLAFEFAPTGSTFPAQYQGALFFADHSRNCIWAMKKSGNPIPSPGSIDTFDAGAASPVDLEFGPGGDLYYVDFDGGTVRRIHYVDSGVPTITSQTPAPGATGVGLNVHPTASFSESMDPSTLTTSTFTLVKQGTSTPLSATVAYDDPTRTATLTPGASLLAGTSYTATVKGGSGGAKDLAGNALAADVSWTFTTGSQQTSSTYLSDLNWVSMINGSGQVEKDKSVGTYVDGDGNTITLNGTTYAKGLGAHAVSDVRYLLNGCNRFKASIGVDDEVANNGSVVFQVYADSTKVYESPVLTGASSTVNVDVDVSGATELGLLVQNGGDNVEYDHADWALARIECGGGGDTTPPTIASQTPAPGATGVGLNVHPTASFSESMDPSTLTTSTFTLVKQGTSTPLSATVAYDDPTRTATLTPGASLLAGTSYTATVKGGSGGAKDLAGNALAADVSWTFTTGAGGGNQPPTPVIDTPAPTLKWKVGDLISFSGHATDPEDGTLPASALTWTLVLQHCPSNCHTHIIQSWTGASSGSFNAPDHDYPSWLELQLTAADSSGASASTTLRLDPQTVVLTFASSPTGLQLVVGSTSSTTSFTRTVIVGSSNSISATSPQTLGTTTYQFSSWSDGGAQTHNIVAPASPTTYTATFVVSAPPANTSLPNLFGQAKVGRTLTVSNGTWTGTQPITFAYQWLRCTTTALSSCTDIVGANSSSYVVTSANVGYRLRARVSASNSLGSTPATSNPTTVVR